MSSKEDILAKRIIMFPQGLAPADSGILMTDKNIKRNVYAAMDEYAKEIAIGFYKWCLENDYITSLETEQLFNQYLTTLQP